MKQNTLETIIGAFVILAAGFFFYFALHNLEHRKSGGYELTAQFSNVDGLAPGSAVRVSGVKVGTVSKITIDAKTYLAVVSLRMQPDIRLPSDTLASIISPGLLGEKYMSLEPGNADDMLPEGGMIVNTQSAASLEKLLGQVIFNLQNLGKNNNSSGSPGAAPSHP